MIDHTNNPNQAGGAFDFSREGYNRVEVHDITTNDVESATVYGRDDEKIGAVSNLVVGADGKITHAIVDVGGFLGLGAHPVKLPFGDLTVLRATDGSDVRVNLGTTKEQLEGMPKYEG